MLTSNTGEQYKHDADNIAVRNYQQQISAKVAEITGLDQQCQAAIQSNPN